MIYLFPIPKILINFLPMNTLPSIWRNYSARQNQSIHDDQSAELWPCHHTRRTVLESDQVEARGYVDFWGGFLTLAPSCTCHVWTGGAWFRFCVCFFRTTCQKRRERADSSPGGASVRMLISSVSVNSFCKSLRSDNDPMSIICTTKRRGCSRASSGFIHQIRRLAESRKRSLFCNVKESCIGNITQFSQVVTP